MGNIRDAIRECRDEPRRTISVMIPGISDPVILKKLKYGEMKDLTINEQVPIDRIGVLLTRMIVNNDGDRILQDHEAPELDELPPGTINALFEEAGKLNGTTKEAVQSTIKNSEANPNGSFVSA